MEPVFNLSGLNFQGSPLQHSSGETLVAINVDFNPIGGISKRAGLVSFLNNPDNAQVNSLFSWRKDDDTTLTVYRASGSALYYSAQGTANWAVASNGTITNGGTVRSAVLNNVLILGDNVGSTRHTTDGTTFTNTILAPVAGDFLEYQQRIYAIGTTSTLFYSSAGDATDWNTSAPSDSNSLTIPGKGRLLRISKASDRLITHKTSGLMHRWDGAFLVDMATKLALDAPSSLAQVEDTNIWLNTQGIYTSNGGQPQLMSRLIQPQIYNDNNTGIAGTALPLASGEVHKYQYLLSVGNITDDIAQKTIGSAVITYDFLTNMFANHQYPFKPTAMHSYKDANGNVQIIMSDANGNVYQRSGTATTDNGTAIYAEVMGFIHGGTLLEKKWDRIRASFNPGSEAQISVAITDSFRLPVDNKTWIPLGDVRSGVVEYRFPPNTRGRFLFWKITDNSKASRFSFHGFEYEASTIARST